MGAVIDLTDAEWARIEGVFDPPGRRGAPAIYPRRAMVEAMLFLARTGCQWRYLPDRYPPWQAVWQQWRRWRTSGVWERAMRRIREEVRSKHARFPTPSMVMIDAQTVRGGRSGPTFHDQGGRGGRTMGTKRSILVEVLGLPVAARVDPASPHDAKVGRELLRDRIDELPRLAAVMGDRGYRGLARLAASRGLALDIKVPPKPGTVPPPPPQPGKRTRRGVFFPIMPLVRVEHAFAQLGRWRRLSRCYEGTEESALAWLEVAALGYLFARLRVEPA